MAEATSSTSSSSSSSATPKATLPADAPQQVMVQSAKDSELQPDALRGNDQLKQQLIDNGTLVDMEDDRKAVYKDKK